MPPRVKKTLYNKESLLKAFNAVKRDGMSTRGASKLFSVPRQKLNDEVLGHSSVACKHGAVAILSEDEETVSLSGL